MGVSFDLRPGEAHALVGENRAGKSTLIEVVSRTHRTDAGALAIAGTPVTDDDPVKARAFGVAVVYRQPALFPDLSVAESIALAVEPPGVCRRVRWVERRARGATPWPAWGRDPPGRRGRVAHHAGTAARRDRQGGGNRCPDRRHGRADRVAVRPRGG